MNQMDSLEQQIINSCYVILEQLPNSFFERTNILPNQFLSLLRIAFITKLQNMTDEELYVNGITLTKEEVAKVADIASSTNRLIDKFILGEVTALGILENDTIIFGQLKNEEIKEKNEQ